MESPEERFRLEEPEQRGHKSPKEIQESIDSFEKTDCKPLSEVSFGFKHTENNKFMDFIKNAIVESQTNILQFEGGRIKHFLDQWKQITTDNEILKIVNGIELEFKDDMQVRRKIPKQCNFNEEEKRAIDAEVNKLLAKKIIESENEDGKFVSPIFLRPKKNRTFRLICNLKELNEFIVYRLFKIESLQSALRMMTKNCYMASIDLKDAYYCIPIWEKISEVC